MINLAELDRVFIVCGKIDMRQGIESLSYIVKKSFNLDPFSGCVFLFCGSRRADSKHFIGAARDSGCSISALRMGSWPGRAMKTKFENCPMSKSCA